MHAMKLCLAFLGRLLLGSVFLLSCAKEMFDWQGAEQYMLQKADSWSMLYATDPMVAGLLEEIRLWLPWALLGGTLLKLFGSLMMILGWHVRWGAFFLLLFLIPETVFMHDFWHLSGVQKELEWMLFVYNGGILGGLFLVLAFGNGVEQKIEKKREED